MQGLAIRIGIIAAIVIGGAFLSQYLMGAASNMKAGDCFDEPQGLETVEDVQRHPCSDAHTAEVFFTGDYPKGDGTYPADDAVEAWVGDNCLPAYQTYTGRDFQQDPDYGIGWFQPDEEGWSSSQQIICYLYRLDGGTITESQKAAS